MCVLEIAGRKVGKDFPVFIIVEISANHSQDFDQAVKMITTAKECGADAVKFQAYTPDTMTINCDNKFFRIKHPKWGGQTLYELYKKAYTPWEWFKELKKMCDDSGILFFATAFDKTSVDFLEDLNVQVHKISSFELVDLPLIEYTAKTEKPLIISTEMGSKMEIKDAVDVAKANGCKDIILLKCVSGYPARAENMDLRTICDMQETFKCPIGFSDHSLGIGASICAAALGACMVEKHFTISRKTETPDSFFSIEPDELKELVCNIRIAEKALGKVHYGLTDEEKSSKNFRRSLFVVKDVKAGEKVTNENIRSIRPGCGLPTKYIKKVIGHLFKKDLSKGTPLSWDLVEGNR